MGAEPEKFQPGDIVVVVNKGYVMCPENQGIVNFGDQAEVIRYSGNEDKDFGTTGRNLYVIRFMNGHTTTWCGDFLRLVRRTVKDGTSPLNDKVIIGPGTGLVRLYDDRHTSDFELGLLIFKDAINDRESNS